MALNSTKDEHNSAHSYDNPDYQQNKIQLSPISPNVCESRQDRQMDSHTYGDAMLKRNADLKTNKAMKISKMVLPWWAIVLLVVLLCALTSTISGVIVYHVITAKMANNGSPTAQAQQQQQPDASQKNFDALSKQLNVSQEQDGIKANVNSLFANMGTLQKNFDALSKQLNISQEQLGLKDVELARLQIQNSNMTTMLADRDSLLHKSQKNFDALFQQLNVSQQQLGLKDVELARLQIQFNNMTAMLAERDSLLHKSQTSQKNFDVLYKLLNVSQEQLGLKDVELARLQIQNSNITTMLMDRDSLLHKSQQTSQNNFDAFYKLLNVSQEQLGLKDVELARMQIQNSNMTAMLYRDSLLNKSQQTSQNHFDALYKLLNVSQEQLGLKDVELARMQIQNSNMTAMLYRDSLLNKSQGYSCQNIDGIKANVNSLFANIGTLQNNFDALSEQLNISQEQLGLRDLELARLQIQNSNMTAMLADRDSLLNKSQVDLANTVVSMNLELTRLRGALTEATNNLTICQTALNVVDPYPTAPVLYGGYTTSYCGFEDTSYCGYTLSTCHESDEDCWKQGTGRQNTNSGPKEDHTFGTPHGHYLYIDPYNRPAYNSNPVLRLAQVTSPTFQPAHAYCVRFWYTMYGNDIGTVNVYAKVGSGNGYPVFHHTGQIDPEWHMVQVSLDAEYTSSPFRVVIEGSTDSHYSRVYTSGSYYPKEEYYKDMGYIAIDDVYVYNTTCSSIPACPDNTYTYHDLEQNTTSCYTFHAAAMTWYDAVNTCKLEAPNGHLVSVTSKREQDFLVDTVRTNTALNTAGQYGYYTSGNDERVEGSFVWTDTGYPYALNYTNWQAGQPNNVGNAQQCLLLQYADVGYEWGDVNCNNTYPFICEIHV